ncbi:MAG: flavodoxin domain-containing protein [Desulfobacterales bacterium]|jgi:flavodoxin
MARTLIAYATRTDETARIADLIGEGLRFAGHEAVVKSIKEIKSEAALDGYDAYVFGSPTYHGEMLQGMKTFLFLAEKASLEGKVGGAFGAHGWSTEAPERIFETMKTIFKMKMVSGPLLLKSSDLGGGIQMAQDYGREIAAKLS